MQVPLEPVFTLIMGILILLVPRLLNYFGYCSAWGSSTSSEE